jgi:hypothetical protein
MRRLIAGLVLALAAAVLPASPAAAGVAVGTVTGVTSDVNERTPLYHLELVFTVANVQCPAVVDYEIGGDTRSAPVDQCVVDAGGFFPAATATTMRPMFGEGIGTINPGGTDCDSGAAGDGPGCQVDVFVRHEDAPVLTTDLRPLLAGASPVEVPIPPRPVWVGVGDGYTSRTTQMADWCYDATPEAVTAGEIAQGGYVEANPYTSPDGAKYDGTECIADVPYFDPDTERYVYQELAFPWDIYYYDPVAEVFEALDGDGVLQPAPHITMDDVIPVTDEGSFLTVENHPGQSWINGVVQTFNREYTIDDDNIPCADPTDDSRCWQVVPEVVADSTVFAADLVDGAADPADQLGQLEALLTSDRHQGSWNWVGLSAGLLDAGIPQAIQAQYPTSDGSYLYEPLDGSLYDPVVDDGYVPWRPAGGDPCPALPEVDATAQATVQAGIENVLDKAMAWSPGLKAIVVRYPWLTERTSTETGEENPCAADGDLDGVPDNREPIAALNAAIDAALADFSVGDDVFALNLAAELDLEEGFTDEPTDSVPGRVSYLQLTRPVGYPYPSDAGSSSMGQQAYDSIEESGLQPPTISGVVVQAADGDPTSPSVDADLLRNGAGWYRADSLYVEWRADAPEGIAQLTARSPLLRGANRSYTGTVVDTAGQVATAPATVSWDPDPPSVTSTLEGGVSLTTGSGVTWWRSRPTVRWQVVEDVNLDLYDMSSHKPSGADQVPPAVSSYPDGTGVVVVSGTASDVAGNTATGQRTLNVDTVAPTLTATVSTGAAWSKAASSTVTWHRFDATSGVAVSPTSPGVAGSTTSLVAPPVTAEGRTTVWHTVLDVAGNSTTGSVGVLLDRTRPDITIPGAPAAGPDGSPAVVDVDDVASRLDTIADRGCAVVNTNPGVNEVSPIAYRSDPVMEVEPGDGGLTYTFTCTARDEAGNERVVTAAFFVEVTDPPTIQGEFVVAANAAGWWRSNVQIDWTATPADGWGLHPFLGDLDGGDWDIDGDTGVGTRRTTHSTEGVYRVESPTACHAPRPGGTCAEPITMRIRLDKTAPQVASQKSGPIGGNGWYLGPVTVDWVADDVIPAGSGLTDADISGVPASAQPPSVTVSAEGENPVTTGTVSDGAGNTATGSETILIDSTKPTITAIRGVLDGALYTLLDAPKVDDVECDAVDLPPATAPAGTRVSQVDDRGCVAALVGSTDIVDDLPPVNGEHLGPPLREVVWGLTVSDHATNTTRQAITTRVLQFQPGRNGRMTVGGHLDTTRSGRVRTSGTLRCNGSPNDLGVSWNGGSFTLDWIDHFYCWDQGNLEGNPGAPIDSLHGLGRGRLADGRQATIEWTFKDREVPANRQDTMRIRITAVGANGSQHPVLDVGGRLTGGNLQAHDAPGNGTNDNGNVNGPTGNTSNRAALSSHGATVPAVLPERPKIS